MRQITIAIHTYPYALQLKKTLEDAGIEVALQNVNLEHPTVAPGVRVRIQEHELAKALRIIEVPGQLAFDDNDGIYNPLAQVVVPTDLTALSENALRVGAAIAGAHDTGLLLLHSFLTPSMITPPPLSEELDFDSTDTAIADAETDNNEERRMHALGLRISREMEDGLLPHVIIEKKLCQGIPEETIAETAKTLHPLMIVMGTRAAAQKEQEVVGSVAAEVLDTVRCPVLTIPGNCPLSNPDEIKRVVMFVVPDQQDIVAVDTMSRLLPLNEGCEVLLVNTPTRRNPDADSGTLSTLQRYCEAHYPALRFSVLEVKAETVAATLGKICGDTPHTLACIPTRKRNILARLFNPTLAHRMVFKADVAMLTIPV